MQLISRKSKYQLIDITQDPIYDGAHVLHLDDAWQYNSYFEFRYHETMAILSGCAAQGLTRALICGGGDGLAARELLKFPSLEIDLVEIDPMMIELYQTEKILTDLNRGSLLSPRVHIYTQDAIQYARSCRDRYDLILLDFPSPNDANILKDYQNLFSAENCMLFSSLLNPWGIMSAQASVKLNMLAPYLRSFLSQGFYAWSYDIAYDNRGQHDTFVSVSKRQLTQERPVPFNCLLIEPAHVRIGFSKVTEITPDHLEYYQHFLHKESVELEQRV